MATKYVCVDVPVSENLTLYLDGNSKITVGNGTYDNPVPNAISLPHISTCPGATKQCMASCYVYGLQKNAPEVYAKYCQNERVLHRLLMSMNSFYKSSFSLAEWIIENCKDGFRWHVSGDVMNERHAQWIVNVAKHSSNVRHWIYTRSLHIVPTLVNSQNLVRLQNQSHTS